MKKVNIWRIVVLQTECYKRGHKKWAVALGKIIKEYRGAHPDFII
jgi:hypothetical protein